jgi:hypothetical protein
MNAEQKRAWLGVITTGACVVGYLVLLPLFGPHVAFSAFAIFAINGCAGNIGRNEVVDERDKSIARRATMAGAMASYMAFILGCMWTGVVVYAFQRQVQVDVHVLGRIVLFGGIAFYATRCVVILELYGRHVEADDV